ncbi:MAG: BREX-3 system P-loop-containing protein BrxF [Firmicutes bacterium]|nr:BREX-3 system P-loop-containing protein BrxF [Bacillota bacterium]MDD3298856.1 BREX-3 system P-loop-containing protein BrxF [Bacillota bacterium]MDD3851827.1 BREX-3 system P-loop-containing protein BrxF [Bacillota bacterium]MDD4708357.1 BREX-3 system P-loop-containing protein BrxF [Bacillota bacterium]
MNEYLKLEHIAKGYSADRGRVIIACADKDFMKVLFSDWEWLNLGLVVSKRLLSLDKDLRKQAVADMVKEAIRNTRSGRVVVDNIDLLFSPEYSLDVIKLFIMAANNKNLIILWEGTFKDGMVTYSEPGFGDYHIYEIDNYNAYCITK